MMKRVLTLLLSLLLPAAFALAQEDSIATYQLPAGAEVCYLTEADELAVPDGLEPMYDLMKKASLRGDVYLMRMANGRALASVSCTPASKTLTAEELLAFWPQIAQNIAGEVNEVNDDSSCASVANIYGVDLLHIRTDMSVGTDAAVPLEAEAFAFCQDGAMYEIWAVWPAEALYLPDEAAAAELESDKADLALFLDSLDFTGDRIVLEGTDYADPEGRFTMKAPMDSTIITPDTSMDEVAAARERFAAANEPGADNVFDQLMKDVYEQQVTLMLTGDMKGAVLVFCSREKSFAGATPAMLASLAEPIRQSLAERFGLAMTLSADGRAAISGKEHAFLGYWLRSEDCDVQLDVLACVLGEDWLCEVDIFTIDGDQTLRAILSSLIAQTLTYTVK